MRPLTRGTPPDDQTTNPRRAVIRSLRGVGGAADFRALYAEHRDAVWRYALRRLGDRQSAEDATTEVFVVAWRRRDQLPAEPLPWLYGVARKVVANQRRSAERRRGLLDRLAGTAGAAAAALPDVADLVGEREELRAALAQLSDGDREILALAAWEDLDADRIAQVLGCRRGTASVRLHRARARLRTALETHAAPAPDPTGPAARRPVPAPVPERNLA